MTESGYSFVERIVENNYSRLNTLLHFYIIALHYNIIYYIVIYYIVCYIVFSHLFVDLITKSSYSLVVE